MRVVLSVLAAVALSGGASPAEAAPTAVGPESLATSPAAPSNARSGATTRGGTSFSPRLEYRWARWIPWVVLGAGAVVAGVGIPLVFSSMGDYARYDRQWDAWCHDPLGCSPSDRPTSLVDLEVRANAKRIAAFALIGLGGAAVITGLVLALLNTPRLAGDDKSVGLAEPPRFLVTATPLSGGAAVMTRLRF